MFLFFLSTYKSYYFFLFLLYNFSVDNFSRRFISCFSQLVEMINSISPKIAYKWLNYQRQMRSKWKLIGIQTKTTTNQTHTHTHKGNGGNKAQSGTTDKINRKVEKRKEKLQTSSKHRKIKVTLQESPFHFSISFLFWQSNHSPKFVLHLKRIQI